MATLIEIETKRSHSVGAHTIIGRGDSCEIRIDDPMVSSTHAEITQSPDGSFQIRDLGSRRGTFVGSKKVSETPLKDGDELMIGPMRMRFAEDKVVAPHDSDELIRLRAIVELGRAIGVEHDLERLAARVLETCFELLEADRGAIVIYEPHSKAPFLTVTRRCDGDGSPFTVSTSVLGQVMVSHEPYMRTEVDSDTVLQRSESLSAHGVRSVMAVPLRYEADEMEWLGLIQLDSRAMANVFRPRDLDLLAAIAGPTALAIKNAMLVRQVQNVISDEWRRLDRVVRDLPLGVIVLDENRRCVMANQWIAKRESDIGPCRPGSIIGAIAGISSERMVGADVRKQITTDSERIFAITANTSADGRETVIVIGDITEERERQTQAAHRDRVALIGQLAGGVAHDFNNLLHVILTYANMLEESITDPDQRDDAHQITHAATSAAELTRQLLTFSRRELVKPKVVDVQHVVQGMEKMLIRTLGPQIELSTSIGPRIPRILIDTSQLEQILMNLLVNARDAMLGKGSVSLTVSAVELDAARAAARAIEPGKYVSIGVHDSGPGMAPDIALRIFEPYFTTKARGKGTGLGLATVHGIVQQARGDITVESAPGEGTTFRIYLPATEQLPDEVRPSEKSAQASGTILVVDDDDDVRRVTERILRNAGYDVLSATSGPSALVVARERTGVIDLLLTDIVMPGMSGRDLAREIAVARADIRVIFMSGYHQHAPIANSQFIAKPFGRLELLDKVRDCLASDPAARM
jgi:signal transduction histidine kinase/CheY-like chemotaxis protein